MAPTDADPTGEWYCFERGAKKDSGGDGWDAEISEDEALRRLLNLNEGLSRRETVADP